MLKQHSKIKDFFNIEGLLQNQMLHTSYLVVCNFYYDSSAPLQPLNLYAGD